MRIKEEYIVPALGAIALLSVFGFATSGLSLVYPVLLGILGLAAVGTFFLPPAVQVEVRIAIAALGLIILVFYFSSVSFWLALLAFGAIGASQIRHGSVLTMPPHTVAYVKALLEKQGASGAEVAGSEGDGDGSGATPQTSDASDATGATAPAAAVQGLGLLRRMLRVNVGGIGGSVLGVFILFNLFLIPWVALTAAVEYRGETEFEVQGLRFQEVASEIAERLDDGVPGMLFIVLAVVAAVSTASVILPRWAVIVTCIAGMAVTLVSYIYILDRFGEIIDDYGFGSGLEASIVTLPHFGCLLAGGSFLVIAVLQLIPRFNGVRG